MAWKELDSVQIESMDGTVHYNDVVHCVTFWDSLGESLLVIDAPPLHRLTPSSISDAYGALRNFYEVPDNARVAIQGIRSSAGDRAAVLLISIDRMELSR